MIIEIEKKECRRDLAAICIYDSSVVANERGGELYSDLIKAHGTVIIVGSDHEVVKSRRVGKCGVVSQVSEDRVATGIEDFDDLIEEGIPRGAWSPRGIHVVEIRVPQAGRIMGSKEETSLGSRNGAKLTATTESCASGVAIGVSTIVTVTICHQDLCIHYLPSQGDQVDEGYAID